MMASSTRVFFFGNTNEKIDFEHVQLRPHQDWTKDKWVAAPKVLF